MKSSTTELPEVGCPKCRHVWVIPDWNGTAEAVEDTSFDCPNCGALVECHEIESIHTAYWYLGERVVVTPVPDDVRDQVVAPDDPRRAAFDECLRIIDATYEKQMKIGCTPSRMCAAILTAVTELAETKP